MSQISLWKGLCADFSPDPILIDDLIGKRMRKAGFKGSRSRGKCTFASTCKSQAECYTDGEGTLVRAVPAVGTLISWSPDTPDLIMAFETFLKNEYWNEAPWASPRAFDIIVDIQGCISTFDRYLQLMPRSRVIPQIVDQYLSTISVEEVIYASDAQMTEALGDHEGEVWITGPCTLVPVTETSKTCIGNPIQVAA